MISGRALTGRPSDAPQSAAPEFWSVEPTALLTHLRSRVERLSATDATERRETYGPNVLRDERGPTRLDVFGRQWRSPLLLLLVFAAVASALTGQWMDAAIVLTIVVATVMIGYTREYSAQAAAAALRTRLSVRTVALRDGQAAPVPIGDIVPGDVVLLSAGSLVPADGVILESADFYVSEAIGRQTCRVTCRHAYRTSCHRS